MNELIDTPKLMALLREHKTAYVLARVQYITTVVKNIEHINNQWQHIAIDKIWALRKLNEGTFLGLKGGSNNYHWQVDIGDFCIFINEAVPAAQDIPAAQG